MVQLLFLIIHTVLTFYMNFDNSENPLTLMWMRFSAYSEVVSLPRKPDFLLIAITMSSHTQGLMG